MIWSLQLQMLKQKCPYVKLILLQSIHDIVECWFYHQFLYFDFFLFFSRLDLNLSLPSISDLSFSDSYDKKIFK